MTTDPDLLDDLVARGLVQDTTDRDALAARLREGPITVYCGFDPTAASLHVGNLIGLLTLRRFQEAGHCPVPLAGGATGMIGDPSGKSDERNLLDDDALADNLAGIVPSLQMFVDFDGVPNAAKLLDNRAWTVSTSLLDFLRDIGKHITINQMAAKESVRARMAGDDGISYTEFSYMLLQAHDYLWLHENEGCELQIGGSDQWGNISLGIDLIRRKTGNKVHGLTWPLLLKADGTKYGKTAGGETIWLNPDHLSPYRFYQAWMQSDDSEVRKLLLQLTFLDLDTIDEVVDDHESAPHRRVGQRRLATELTSIVHGDEASTSARAASDVVFGGSVVDLDESTFEMLSAEVPTSTHDRADLNDDDNLVPLLVAAGVASSKSEAGRLLKQNGVSVNDEKVSADVCIDRSMLLHDRYCVVRKGKRSVFLLIFGGPETT
ncbi:MAG: tyrosine--tRNA ligase [Actinomycetia bacterium]|nr:tyrosine--tRNA ligase [Actinomycetes bacterium]